MGYPEIQGKRKGLEYIPGIAVQIEVILKE